MGDLLQTPVLTTQSYYYIVFPLSLSLSFNSTLTSMLASWRERRVLIVFHKTSRLLGQAAQAMTRQVCSSACVVCVHCMSQEPVR